MGQCSLYNHRAVVSDHIRNTLTHTPLAWYRMTLATLRDQNEAAGLPIFSITRATYQYLFLLDDATMSLHWPLWCPAHASAGDALEMFCALVLTSSHRVGSRLDACLSLFAWEGTPTMRLDEVMVVVALTLAGLAKACGVSVPAMQERMEIAIDLHTRALQLQASSTSSESGRYNTTTGTKLTPATSHDEPLQGVYLLHVLAHQKEFIDYLARITAPVVAAATVESVSASSSSSSTPRPVTGFHQSALLSFMPLIASPADRRRLHQAHLREQEAARRRVEAQAHAAVLANSFPWCLDSPPKHGGASAAPVATTQGPQAISGKHAAAAAAATVGHLMFDGSIEEEYAPFFQPTMVPPPTSIPPTPLHHLTTPHARASSILPTTTPTVPEVTTSSSSSFGVAPAGPGSSPSMLAAILHLVQPSPSDSPVCGRSRATGAHTPTPRARTDVPLTPSLAVSRPPAIHIEGDTPRAAPTTAATTTPAPSTSPAYSLPRTLRRNEAAIAPTPTRAAVSRSTSPPLPSLSMASELDRIFAMPSVDTSANQVRPVPSHDSQQATSARPSSASDVASGPTSSPVVSSSDLALRHLDFSTPLPVRRAGANLPSHSPAAGGGSTASAASSSLLSRESALLSPIGIGFSLAEASAAAAAARTHRPTPRMRDAMRRSQDDTPRVQVAHDDSAHAQEEHVNSPPPQQLTTTKEETPQTIPPPQVVTPHPVDTPSPSTSELPTTVDDAVSAPTLEVASDSSQSVTVEDGALSSDDESPPASAATPEPAIDPTEPAAATPPPAESRSTTPPAIFPTVTPSPDSSAPEVVRGLISPPAALLRPAVVRRPTRPPVRIHLRAVDYMLVRRPTPSTGTPVTTTPTTATNANTTPSIVEATDEITTTHATNETQRTSAEEARQTLMDDADGDAADADADVDVDIDAESSAHQDEYEDDGADTEEVHPDASAVEPSVSASLSPTPFEFDSRLDVDEEFLNEHARRVDDAADDVDPPIDQEDDADEAQAGDSAEPGPSSSFSAAAHPWLLSVDSPPPRSHSGSHTTPPAHDEDEEIYEFESSHSASRRSSLGASAEEEEKMPPDNLPSPPPPRETESEPVPAPHPAVPASPATAARASVSSRTASHGGFELDLDDDAEELLKQLEW